MNNTNTTTRANTNTTTNTTTVGICGLGCVGDAMYQHFLKHTDLKPVGYDKYVKNYSFTICQEA